MAISARGTELEWGPSIRIHIALTCKGECESLSKEYVLDDLAKIYFKYVTVNSNGNLHIKFYYSSKKIGLTNNSAVKIKVMCKSLNYSKHSVCSDEWSNWCLIGVFDTYEFEGVFCATYDLFATVWEEKIDTLSSKLYNDTDFTDFCLSTDEDGDVAVHKACLAANSDVFKTMLTGDWKETSQGKIRLEGVTLQTLQHFKEYLYLGVVPDNGLRPLLLIAQRFLIKNLEEQCIRKLAETVSSEELLSLIEFACENNIPDLAFAITKLTQDSVVYEAHRIRKREDASGKKLNSNNS